MRNSNPSRTLLLLYLCALIGLNTGCQYDSLTDEKALQSLTETGSFVRFDNSLMDTIFVEEGQDSTVTPVVYPFPGQVDLQVTYTLGGSALFNIDYTIEGAEPAGGNVDLIYDPETTLFSTSNITILILEDTIPDGAKTVQLELEAAIASDGRAIEVGQGGLYKYVVVVIADND